MSAESVRHTIESVLSEHPDYRTRLDEAGWWAVCTGQGCGWEGELPPAGAVADAAPRAYREHIAGQLVAAGLSLPDQPDHGPLAVHIEAPQTSGVVRVPGLNRCPLCGMFKGSPPHEAGCPGAVGAARTVMARRRAAQ